MKKKVQLLLAVDAIINLLLGLLLLLLPAGLLKALGLPPTDTYFYTSILGGVIFGIGIALLLEWLRGGKGVRGLGLAGAIAINLCGGGVLLYWLLFSDLNLPLRPEFVPQGHNEEHIEGWLFCPNYLLLTIYCLQNTVSLSPSLTITKSPSPPFLTLSSKFMIGSIIAIDGIRRFICRNLQTDVSNLRSARCCPRVNQLHPVRLGLSHRR